MAEEPLELKIFKSLFESPKTFNQLLKAGFQISRPTLTIKLDALEKANLITKKTRKSPYEINRLYFNRSPLYHTILSAYLFNQLYFDWMEKFSRYVRKDWMDEDGRIMTYPKPKLLVEYLEKEMGNILLNLLILQTEKNIDLPVSERSQQVFELITKFIRFISKFVDSNEWLREQVKKTEQFKEMEELSVKPYSDIEKEFMDMADLLLRGSELVLQRPPDIETIEKNPALMSVYTSMLMHDHHFYKEIGFPFDMFYERAVKKIREEKFIDKVLSDEG